MEFWRPSWILKNATWWNFTYSLEIITPDPYEPKSIIKKTLYHLSTLCEIFSWLFVEGGVSGCGVGYPMRHGDIQPQVSENTLSLRGHIDTVNHLIPRVN